MDLIDRNPGIRFLTSSKRRFPFRQFNDPEKQVKDSKPKSRSNNYFYTKIIIEPLDDISSVDLLLSKCQKEISRRELGMTDEDTHTLHKRLELEENVRLCRGLPEYIIMFAKILNNHPFNEIHAIEKEPD
jgi:hypothetical protein